MLIYRSLVKFIFLAAETSLLAGCATTAKTTTPSATLSEINRELSRHDRAKIRLTNGEVISSAANVQIQIDSTTFFGWPANERPWSSTKHP